MLAHGLRHHRPQLNGMVLGKRGRVPEVHRSIVGVALVVCLVIGACSNEDDPVAPEENPDSRLRDSSCVEGSVSCPPDETMWIYACDDITVNGNMLQSDYDFVVGTVGDSLRSSEHITVVVDYRLSTTCTPAPEPGCVVNVSTFSSEEPWFGRRFWFELDGDELQLWQVITWPAP